MFMQIKTSLKTPRYVQPSAIMSRFSSAVSPPQQETEISPSELFMSRRLSHKDKHQEIIFESRLNPVWLRTR